MGYRKLQGVRRGYRGLQEVTVGSIILVFILVFRLVSKLVFLYFNVNVYLKEIPCLNKVTVPYLI